MPVLTITETIAGSVITTLGSIIVVFITVRNNIKLVRLNKKLDEEVKLKELESKQTLIKYDVVTNLLRFSQYQKLYDAVINMMEKSNVDRFLIFLAINGKVDLKHVTCIFQKFRDDKRTIDAVSVYKGLEVDNDYLEKLKRLELYGELIVETNAEAPSLIKSIYESEGINWSRWKFIGRVNIDEKNDLISYCSAATFKEKDFNSKDLLAIKLNVEGIIKPEILKTVKEMKLNKN